jgi:predicted outer membrane repeat protein
MSERSMIRNHRREVARKGRRGRLAAGAAAVAGAAAIAAPGAQAANFQVTTLADDGPGSLRAALANANANADADNITFQSGLTGEIDLTTGELGILAAVDIQGPGAGALSIDAGDASRIFDINADTVGAERDPVSISGLTMRRGSSSGGGAIYVETTDLSLDSVTISDSEAGGTGGAIDLESSPIEITGSTITGNTASSGGGAMYTDGVNAENNDEDTVTIRDSVLTDNESGSNGGVLYVDNATGGDILIVDSTVHNNRAPSSSGGGLFFYGSKGKVTVRNSTVSGNTASDGGGIFFNSDYYQDGLKVENTTVSGNTATDAGGGIYSENALDEIVEIENSTVVGNTATGRGGGIYRDDFSVDISSTIVADNNGDGGDDDLGEPDVVTEAFTLGNSLIESGAAEVTVVETPAGTNKLGADPQLAALADNGGPTQTHLPAEASPAVDAGVANGLTLDQRGLARTADKAAVANFTGSDGTDIGAVELQNPPPVVDEEVTGAVVSAKKKQKQKKKKIVVKVTVGADEAVDASADGSVKTKKKSYPLKTATGSTAAGEQTVLMLKPKKKAAKKISKFLKKGKKAKASLSVTLTDEAGNEATETANVKLVGKKKKKK